MTMKTKRARLGEKKKPLTTKSHKFEEAVENSLFNSLQDNGELAAIEAPAGISS